MSNDRFRFRVWDNENNEYLDEAYPSSIYSDGSLYAFEEKYDANSNEMVALLEIPNNCLIVEQCTGWKDKNGRLIFEGDVVFCESGKAKGVIKFEKGQFVFEWKFAKPLAFLVLKYTDDVEIVGNIHEVKNEQP